MFIMSSLYKSSIVIFYYYDGYMFAFVTFNSCIVEIMCQEAMVR